VGTPYESAIRVRLAERDAELGLAAPRWPNKASVPDGWEGRRGHLERTISRRGDRKDELALRLRELVLRFPSAPVGVFRRFGHEEPHSEDMHTYRVLLHPTYTDRVTRVFLMHNGLDELADVSLYYRLASYLIAEDHGTACILRPLPGHLTRSPFQAFSQTPLATYLWDGSNLFQQFLRYMIETRWFLSVLARRSSYRCASGISLLAEAPQPAGSRTESGVLAASLTAAWAQLAKASWDTADGESRPVGPEAGDGAPLAPFGDDRLVGEAVRSLREVLRLEEDYPAVGGDLPPPDPKTGVPPREEPPIHVIGYSLGGFAAQSIFMSWPFMVSSCVTLLSGGALRELAPTAFAHPEEWQTVLHSLRYELDDALLRRLPDREDDGSGGRTYHGAGPPIAGIDADLFMCLKRTFYEVFQQEYRGSFQTRLAAFRRSMMFVVGGNDPIVPPEAVLRSGPPGGMNMVAIGGLGHFLGNRAQDDEELEQRTFWLPQVARLTHRFANDAADRQDRARPGTWLDPDMNFTRDEEPSDEDDDAGDESAEPRLKRFDISERLAVRGDGSLPGELFRRGLEDLLARVEENPDGGVLFILRNEIPTLLLEDRAIQERAASLHHDDGRIAAYVDAVRTRREVLLKRPGRVCVVLPWDIEHNTKRLDLRPRHPSQSESVGSMVVERTTPEGTWRQFVKDAGALTKRAPDAVRVFDGRARLQATRANEPSRVGVPPVNVDALLEAAERPAGHERLRRVPALPDCWVWLSADLLYDYRDRSERLSVRRARELLCEMAPTCYENEGRLARHLSDDDVRILSVSRARYNPRFRGRILAQPRTVGPLLLHVALCVAGSVPFATFMDGEAGAR
jgi:hypothetical protein